MTITFVNKINTAPQKENGQKDVISLTTAANCVFKRIGHIL